SDKELLLATLARVQLAQNRFDVAMTDLQHEMGARIEFDEDSLELRASRFLEQIVSGGTARMRCRHDLLDGFNIAQILMNNEDGNQLRKDLYVSAHLGLGRYVLQS